VGHGAAMRVWPALPAPGELVRLPLPCPPQLVQLSGYDGAGRLVALWWSPLGDQLIVCDGTLTVAGRWRGWLCFCEHPLVRLFLEPYRLGDSDDQGEHRLLVDRYLGTLEVGLARDVEQLLATQPSELHALTTGACRPARRRCCCNGRSTSRPTASGQRASSSYTPGRTPSIGANRSCSRS
jgi:hypothetical protein